jgi:hypothetical protein
MKLCNNKIDRGDMVFFLVFNLVWSLVWGLAAGLTLGLVRGLTAGLVCGLVWGLTAGLVCGLVGGLGLLIGMNILLFFKLDINWLVFIIGLILIAELYFWFVNNVKLKKKENKFWFTVKRKLISLLISFLIITQIIGGYYIINLLIKWIEKYYVEILKWIGYIGLGIIVLGLIILIFYLWIKINERKYN